MKPSLLTLYLRMIIYGQSQRDVAYFFGIHRSTICRIVNTITSVEVLDHDTFKDFHFEHPILDILLPNPPTGAPRYKVLVGYHEEDAPMIADMALAAASAQQKGSEAEWYYIRNAIRASMIAGFSYEPSESDDDKKAYSFSISETRLQRARALIQQLVTMPCVRPLLRPYVALGARYNELAIDMMIEAARRALNAESAVVRGFDELFSELAAKAPDYPRTEPINDKEKIRLLKQTIFLYTGTALIEIYVETGQLNKINDVVTQLDAALPGDIQVLRRFIILSAWEHNQETLSLHFGSDLKKAS